jgi:chemotaxis protein MotA
MNMSSIFGIIAALVVFSVALFTSTSSYGIFLDVHAILIVLGGTAAAALISFPLKTFVTLTKVFAKRVLGKYSNAHEKVIHEIVDLAGGYRDNPNYLNDKVETIQTPFLKEGVQMLLAGGMTPEKMDRIMRKRALTHYKRHEEEAGIFKIIAKFPPAFGLLGTTLGMIGLLQSLGSPDSFKKLGPAMAIGLVATLYGIATANLVLIPIGENLTKLNKEDEILREMVIDGLKLIRAKEHPSIVEEELKSYLLPSEREKISKIAA